MNQVMVAVATKTILKTVRAELVEACSRALGDAQSAARLRQNLCGSALRQAQGERFWPSWQQSAFLLL